METGQQMQDFPGDKPKKALPDCYEVAKATYPGGCDPKQSGFACYSNKDVFHDVLVHWACSKELDQTDISEEKCPLRPWHFDGEVNGKHLNFTAPAGIYAGACEFSVLPPELETTKAATTPEKATKAATTPEKATKAATTPEKATEAATTPEKATQAATTPEQPTEGATTPEQPVTAATTSGKPPVVATTPEESTQAATTPEQSTKAATTPEKPTVVETTLEQLTDAATTPVQPPTGPTTAKNGAAGSSVGSLLTIFVLTVYSLH